MELILIFRQSILPVFLILAMAFVYERLFRPDLKQIASLALNVFAPVFVFESLAGKHLSPAVLLKPSLFMVMLTATLVGAGFLTAWILRFRTEERVPFVLGVSMINVGNFGLPLILFTYGDEAVTFSVVYFIVFNVPLSTLAIYLSSDKTRFSGIIKDMIKIPIFHAMVLALIFSYFEIPLPGGVQKGLGLVSKGAIPLLIFVLGLQLAQIEMRKGFRDYTPHVCLAVFIRLILSPLAALAILAFLGIHSLEHHVSVIQTSGPSALLPLMYAIRFNKNPELLASIILFTTLFSGVSIPVLIHLL